MGTPAPSLDIGVATFNRAVAYVIDRLEGGGKVISDSGGLTRWGISKRGHPDVDIANLTRDGAIDIYRRHYWNVVKGDLLPPPVALLVFDSGVNMGTRTAIQMLQRVLGVAEDGILGPETLLAVRGFKPQTELRALYVGIRNLTYFELVRRRPVNTGSLKGWIYRSARVADEAARWSLTS
jgi:lysozyme family protein